MIVAIRVATTRRTPASWPLGLDPDIHQRAGFAKANIDPNDGASNLLAMTDHVSANATVAACHCGKVTLSLASRPTEVTECNCSLCCRTGVIWAYYPATDVSVSPDPSPTDQYAWNGCHVDFHRCCDCGCVTHWTPRDPNRERRGINARLLEPEVLASAKVRHLDGANTGKYLD